VSRFKNSNQSNLTSKMKIAAMK